MNKGGKMDDLKKENDELKKLLCIAYNYILEGKRKFTPNTINSLIDDFLNNEKIKEYIKENDYYEKYKGYYE